MNKLRSDVLRSGWISYAYTYFKTIRVAESEYPWRLTRDTEAELDMLRDLPEAPFDPMAAAIRWLLKKGCHIYCNWGFNVSPFYRRSPFSPREPSSLFDAFSPSRLLFIWQHSCLPRPLPSPSPLSLRLWPRTAAPKVLGRPEPSWKRF